MTQDPSADEVLALVEGSHARLVFEQPFVRVAVGDPERAAWDAVDDREILVLGRRTGRTTLLVWLGDGSVRSFDLAVQPDLSILERVLIELHPTLHVEQAADREALVLRGTVPDLRLSRAAEDAARAWQSAAAAPIVSVGDGPIVAADTHDADHEGAVINLIRVEDLPARLDQRLARAVRGVAGDRLVVERVPMGMLPDDERDLFVLSGQVKHQVDLVRAIELAARMLPSSDGEGSITVLADEGGGLSRQAAASAAQLGLGGASFAGGSVLGDSGRQVLSNMLSANPGRATGLSAAGGRLLAFVDVSEQPQVRIDVRIYEVNRTRLRGRAADLALLGSDFAQGRLLPAGAASAVQGSDAARVGAFSPNDVQNVLSFLDGGFSDQLQIVGERLAVDVTLSILESEGLARSLSRPSLTVLSGEQATFQVGGEIPVPTSLATNDGVQGVFNSVEFRAFGVQLDVRPLVDADGLVTLDVAPRLAAPSAELTALVRESTGTSPLSTGFETRALRTSACVEDGETLVIGGLLSQTRTWSRSHTPWLSSIPILGALFERESETADDVELVLVLHPVVLGKTPERAVLWPFVDARALLTSLGTRAEPRRFEGNPRGSSGMDPSDAAARHDRNLDHP